METSAIEQQFDPIQWLMYGDRGVSSETIFAIMIGSRIEIEYDTPRTPSDLRRCISLLDANPQWRLRLQEVADRFPEWQIFVSEWAQLEAIYFRDLSQGASEELAAMLRDFNERCRLKENQTGPGVWQRIRNWIALHTAPRDTLQ